MMNIDRSIRPPPGMPRPLSWRGKGPLSLAVSIGIIAVLWLVVLPWLSARPRMHSHLNWLEQRGIDPSAMFYTELEAMEPILQRRRAAQRKRRNHGH